MASVHVDFYVDDMSRKEKIVAAIDILEAVLDGDFGDEEDFSIYDSNGVVVVRGYVE